MIQIKTNNNQENDDQIWYKNQMKQNAKEQNWKKIN